MIAGISYEMAFEAFSAVGLDKKRGRKHPLSSNFKDVQNAGRAAGILLVKKRYSCWFDVKLPAIMKMNVAQNGNWHWVVARSSESGIELLDPITDLPCFENSPFDVPCVDFSCYKPSGCYLALEV